MKLSKIFLLISIVTFGVGLLDLGESTFWYALRPAGAICFIFYFIFQLLDKETTLLDEQERQKMEALAPHLTRPSRDPSVPARTRSNLGLRITGFHSTAENNPVLHL